MKIEPIERTVPEHLRSINERRCEEKVSSSGTTTFPGKTEKCRRFSAFVIDGEKLCKQHAGDKALTYLLAK